MRASHSERSAPMEAEARTVVGWQGVRCVLPADWNVSGFSMDRDNGYLRVDAPGTGSLVVQVRWWNVARSRPRTLYDLAAAVVRRWSRRPEPPVIAPDLRANLDNLLKETARKSRRSHTDFRADIKPERSEGERTAINFTWVGNGRGQGKIWYCATCHRVLIAQVVGAPQEAGAIGAVASQLMGSLRCHGESGYDLWALYDLQIQIPEDFRLDTQKLLSGYLHLEFARGGERIFLDRWGLANLTLKRFTCDEWLRNHAAVNLSRYTRTLRDDLNGHEIAYYEGVLAPAGKLRAFYEARGSLRRFPDAYAGGIWNCDVSNRIYAIQAFLRACDLDVWKGSVQRCVCH
ncbi:MAG: hypothetical protein RMJ43_06655 [Chloroherpetonaceae bacterium]|nr:hypothetical protein [Chthonomonadaceae bacterium]MDW8207500.1 hypothetical protein [Chloroherpetonaceae bacterium]